MDNKLVKWMDLLTEIWESRDSERVGELVAEKFEYFESVHKPAITSVEELEKTWSIVPKIQKNISGKYKILSFDGVVGIVRYWVVFDNIKTGKAWKGDSVYEVELDEVGKCVVFRQWEEFVEGKS